MVEGEEDLNFEGDEMQNACKGGREFSHDWHSLNCVLISSLDFNLIIIIYSHHSHIQMSFSYDIVVTIYLLQVT